MNETEHVLTVLGEECSEVAKEVSKALRFGLDDKLTMDPDGPRGTQGLDNAAKITEELIQLIAVYEMLSDDGHVNNLGFRTLPLWVRKHMDAKKEKVRAFMKYAEKVGALQI